MMHCDADICHQWSSVMQCSVRSSCMTYFPWLMSAVRCVWCCFVRVWLLTAPDCTRRHWTAPDCSRCLSSRSWSPEVFFSHAAALVLKPWCSGFNWISRKHRIHPCRHRSQLIKVWLLTAPDHTGPHLAHTRPEMTDYFTSTTVTSRIGIIQL